MQLHTVFVDVYKTFIKGHGIPNVCVAIAVTVRVASYVYMD